MTSPTIARVVELDVRDDLREGLEPFGRIMATVGELADNDVLLLRATFEPVPLFTVLGRKGFVHEVQQHAPDDWSVRFWREPATEAASPSEAGVTAGVSGDAPVMTTVTLDVRGLQPPEPLTRTLAALESLPDGHQLVQVNVRVPEFLIPMLAERGYACDVDESHDDRVLVRIWRPVA